MKIAQSFKDTFGNIEAPDPLKGIAGADSTGEKGINTILNRSVDLIFIFAALGFVIMFLWSAVQMILSGGDKESVAKARGRLTWAIIGIALLSLSFVIFQVIGDITGFKFFNIK